MIIIPLSCQSKEIALGSDCMFLELGKTNPTAEFQTHGGSNPFYLSLSGRLYCPPHCAARLEKKPLGVGFLRWMELVGSCLNNEARADIILHHCRSDTRLRNSLYTGMDAALSIMTIDIS